MSLIATCGLNQPEYIVEYAHRVAPQRDYMPQSFWGHSTKSEQGLAAQEKEAREILRRQNVERERPPNGLGTAIELMFDSQLEQ